MNRYVVFEYIEGAEDRTDNVVGYVEAEDPWEACEKLGFTDSSKNFARLLDKMEDEVKYLESAEAQVKKLRSQLDVFVEEDNKAKKEFEEHPICPNCGKELDKKTLTCKACKFGIDVVAVGGVVVPKKELDKMIKKAKKAEKERNKLAENARKAEKEIIAKTIQNVFIQLGNNEINVSDAYIILKDKKNKSVQFLQAMRDSMPIINNNKTLSAGLKIFLNHIIH